MPTTADMLATHGLSPLTLVRTDTSYFLSTTTVRLRQGAYAEIIRNETRRRLGVPQI
jgi:hypothetical protein